MKPYTPKSKDEIIKELGEEVARLTRTLRTIEALAGGYTTEWHRARLGTTDPALCGEKPPGGRTWKAAPKHDDQVVLPPCQKCEAKHEAAILASSVWLAA